MQIQVTSKCKGPPLRDLTKDLENLDILSLTRYDLILHSYVKRVLVIDEIKGQRVTRVGEIEEYKRFSERRKEEKEMRGT